MNSENGESWRWSWHRVTKELRLVVTPEAFAETGVLPAAVLEQAVDLMRSRQQKGEIERYDVHRARLTRTWELAAKAKPAGALWIVAASGQAALPKGVFVERPVRGTAETAILLTIGPDATPRNLRPEWLAVFLRAEMERLDLTGAPHAPDIYAAWARAVWHKELVQRYPVAQQPVEEPAQYLKPWRISFDMAARRIDLVVKDPPAPGLYQTVARSLEAALTTVADADGNSGFCRSFSRHVFRSLRAAARGPESLGVELPLRMAGGIALGEMRDESGGAAPTRLSTLVTAVLAFHRMVSGVPLKAIGGFAFYADERKRMEDRMIGSGFADRRASGGIVLKPWVRLAAVSAKSGWSKRTHQEALTAARTAIGSVSEKHRDIQAVTIGLDEAFLPDLKELVSDLRRRILQIARADKEPDAVFHLATELFPLTRPSGQPPGERTRSFDHASWVMLVLRELIGLKRGAQTPAEIAARLVPRLSPETVAKAFTSLDTKGFIRLDAASGRYVPTAANVLTEQDGGGASLARFHEDMIDLAAAALELSDLRGDFRGVVLCCRRTSLPAMRETLLDFFKSLISLAESHTSTDQLYQLNVRIVPLMARNDAGD